jgi:hypothetical protein
MEVIDDALNEIASSSSDPAVLLQQLQMQEDNDYKLFSESSDPPLLWESHLQHALPLTDLSVDVIYKSPNICHTARLPAETRRLGILTQTDTPGVANETGLYNYDKGTEKQVVQQTPNPDGMMRLTYDKFERQPCAPLVQMDYKDW